MREMKTRGFLEKSDAVRDWACELVAAQVNVVEVLQLGKRGRDGARKLVEGEVQELEVGESSQEVGYWAGYGCPADAKEDEVGELGDGGVDRAGEVRELVEIEGA